MFARHSLVWLTAPGWLAARAAAPAHAPALERWQRANWPLVARRRDPGAGAGDACLGLALPPDPASGAKVRIALRLPAAGVARSAPPLSLKAALATLPEPWRGQLSLFKEASLGLDFRVYGSAALQALTGLDYLRPTSDIDLLLYPLTEQQLRSGLALLLRFDTLPLDGEVVFPNGEAVAWKEWAAAGPGHARVLVKGDEAVRLAPVGALLATLRNA